MQLCTNRQDFLRSSFSLATSRPCQSICFLQRDERMSHAQAMQRGGEKLCKKSQDHVPTLVRRHSNIWRIHNSRNCRRVTAWRNGEEGSDPGTRRKRPARVRQPRRIYTSDQLSQPTFKLLKNSTVSVKRPCRISQVQTTRSSFIYSFL